MRHFVSVLLAVVTGPLVLLLAGRGLVGLAAAAQADRTDHFGLVTSGTALGLAGLVYAVLTMARLAPLGPTLAGAGYVALGWWALQDPDAYLATIQDNPALGGIAVGPTEQHLLMAAQIAPLLAVPLLATFVMPSRWRRSPSDLDQTGEGSGEQSQANPGRALTTDTLDDLPPVPSGASMPYPGAQLSPPHHLASQQQGSQYSVQHPAQYSASPQHPEPGHAPYSPPYSAPQPPPPPSAPPPHSAPQYQGPPPHSTPQHPAPPPHSTPQHPAPPPPVPQSAPAPLTQPPTEPPTVPLSQPQTEPPTLPLTQPQTEPPTVPLTQPRTMRQPPAAARPAGGTLHGAASEEATLPIADGLAGEETTTNLRPGTAAPTDRA